MVCPITTWRDPGLQTDKGSFINANLPNIVLGMDIIGQVLDGSQSRGFQKGDLIVAPGTVGYSDGCSFQTHALVHEDHCAKVSEPIHNNVS